jgi:hypothetical protein
MRPITKTVSAAELSDPIRVDWRGGGSNFNLTAAVALSAGAVLTYDVEYSVDDPQTFTDKADYNANGTWFVVTGLAALSANARDQVDFPIQGIRLNVTAHTSGSATITVLQSN